MYLTGQNAKQVIFHVLENVALKTTSFIKREDDLLQISLEGFHFNITLSTLYENEDYDDSSLDALYEKLEAGLSDNIKRNEEARQGYENSIYGALLLRDGRQGKYLEDLRKKALSNLLIKHSGLLPSNNFDRLIEDEIARERQKSNEESLIAKQFQNNIKQSFEALHPNCYGKSPEELLDIWLSLDTENA